MSHMEIAEHIDALEREGEALADAAKKAGLGANVPPCPRWRVADLIRHTGYVHRWAARNITERPDKVFDGATEDQVLTSGETPDDKLLDWFLDGHVALVGALRTADPAGNYPVFLPDAISPLAFWARRQAHETAIHRADAQLAAGQTPGYDKDFAADGIDELVMGFAARSRKPPKNALGKSMLVRSTDTGRAWHIAWPDEPGIKGVCQRAEADADCVLAGPASGLYLMLWNRLDVRTVVGTPASATTIVGDAEVAIAWRDGFQVRW